MADTPDTEKPKLKPANENPWYCLMTLHGEQPEGAHWWDFDRDLHAKNRRDWNKWAARALSEEQRKALLEAKDSEVNSRFSEDELTPHTEAEWTELAAAFRARAQGGGIADLPVPDQTIELSHTEFARPVVLAGFLFPKAIGLIGATFSGDADLRGATFSGNADLRGATFSGDAYLRGATFSGVAYLSGATFSGDATLRGATFSGGATLRGATFSGYANLAGATFSGDAYLSGATFSRDAYLLGATFSGDANFGGAKFSRENATHFQNTTFGGVANFLNAELEGDTSFARATFKTRPPRFHGAKLNEGTAFDEVTWPAPPPVPVKSTETGDPEKDWEAKEVWERARNALEDDIKSYQRLKQMMETLKKHEDELEFFAREMALKRVLHTANGEIGKARLLELYDKLSDYGRSVARPTIALAWTMGITTFMIWIWMSWDTPNAHSLPKFKNALGLSLANLLAPLNFRKDFFDAKFIADLPDLIKLVSGVQTLSGLLFTFLIGLGLRNRFRMK